MAAFSRGCTRILSRPLQLPNHFLTSPLRTSPPPRFFTTNPPLNASLKPRPKQPTITITKPSIPTPTSPTSSLPKAKPTTKETLVSPSASTAAYISHLASKSTPTLLYTAPSQTIYTIGCYSAAFFCLSYASYTYESTVVHSPRSLDKWVKFAFTGICIGVAAAGVYLVMGPSRLVREIYAVPIPKTPRSILGGGGGGGGITTGRGAPQSLPTTTKSPSASGINIEIHLQSPLPRPLLPYLPSFLRPTTLHTTHPSNLTLSQPLTPLTSTTPRKLSPAEKAILAEAREKHRYKWKTSILTRGFQAYGVAMGRIWEAMKRVLTKEGFADIEVRGGGGYKLDVRGGWVLVDGGKGGLDRLCRIRKA